jgi:hypothetical protein
MRCVASQPSDMLRRAVQAGGRGVVVIRRACNLAWAWMIVLTACGGQGSGAAVVCRDRVTGKCYPCTGAQICIDEVACKVVACGIGHPSDTAKDGSGDGSDASTDTSDVPEVDGGCELGTKRCKGEHQVQNCQGGTWIDGVACATGQVCESGVCGCPNACPALNLSECLSGIPAVRTCQLDSDKCLAWGVPVACKPGEICEQGLCKVPGNPCNPACGGNQTCVSGQCVDKGCVPACTGNQVCQGGTCVTPSTGGLTCAQITACSSNCPVDDSNCPVQCVAQGSSSAQATFNTYKSCIKATCKSLADQGKVNETMFCIYQYCASEQAACLGSGTGTCSQLNDCMNGCGNSATCTSSCNSATSKQGALDFYSLMTCVDNNCAGQTGDAQVQCAQSACSAAFTKCIGTSSGGGTLTSCQAILGCAQGCSDKACAQQCKGAGTPQAQATLQQLLDCENQKCISWCVTGNEPECTQCMSKFCGGEQAACGL